MDQNTPNDATLRHWLRGAMAALAPGDPRRAILAELIDPTALPDRVYAALPAADPRFAALRAFLAPLRMRGSQSPIPAIVGEFARVGFAQFQAATGGGAPAPGPAESDGWGDALAASERHQRVAQATSQFDFE